MPIPPDAAAFNIWRLEAEQTERLLTRIEDAARAQLRALGCPTDPASVFAILNGERPAPWPTRTAARDRHRAHNEMLVLALVSQSRAQLSFGTENSHRAVYYAVHAMALASHAAAKAVLAEIGRQGGRTTGDQQAQQARDTDERIRRLVARWQSSDALQLQHRTATSYVQGQTELSARTVQRHLKRLGLARRIRRSA